jgi:hypothetical protein
MPLRICGTAVGPRCSALRARCGGLSGGAYVPSNRAVCRLRVGADRIESCAVSDAFEAYRPTAVNAGSDVSAGVRPTGRRGMRAFARGVRLPASALGDLVYAGLVRARSHSLPYASRE